MWSNGHLLQSGKYEVKEQLGVGGFGVTYLALDTFLKRQVVIKAPNRQFEKDQEYRRYVRRFQREGQALAQISHPNVVPILEFFKEAGVPCLVMAYIEGLTLNEQIRGKGKISPDIAIRGFIKLTDALRMLHESGLIHCDLHPGNIIVQKNWEFVLIDFGSAKLVQPATVTVTTTVNTNYSPYEQGIHNEKEGQEKKLQPTLDIYGLAATLYFAITAQRPMSSMSRKLYGDKLEEPQQLCEEIPGWLNQAVLKGMALEAHDRPASMEEWTEILYPPQSAQSVSKPLPMKRPKLASIPTHKPTPSNIPKPLPEPSPKPISNTPNFQKVTVDRRNKRTQLLFMWGLGLSGLAAIVFFAINGRNVTDGESNLKTPLARGGESRLQTVLDRGNLICGVDGGIPGFSFVQDGEYSGIDVDICKAVAAALFNDPDAVEYRNLDSTERFEALKGGEVDMLARNTTWTLSRDTSVGMEYAPTIFHDGQGMMVRDAEGLTELTDLEGKSVCVEVGTTTELNLAIQMRQAGVRFEPVVFQDADAAYAAYDAGRCDSMTSDKSQLIARRSTLSNPNEHVLMNVTMSKEPLGPLTKNNDSAWFDAVKWITYALIEAEELGLTSENIADAASSENPNVLRFIGAEGTLGEDMGLPNDFAAKAIESVGNYGEIYERNLGQNSQFNLPRGLNALWRDGGLMYSPPWR